MYTADIINLDIVHACLHACLPPEMITANILQVLSGATQ